ncbi:MAG: protein sspF [Firmicutes bacterium]|nr:protein sspF [Bacillota bacterium]
MSRRKGVASERLKMAAAADIGVADQVKEEGWEGVTTQDVGLVVRNMVKRGEEVLMKRNDHDDSLKNSK